MMLSGAMSIDAGAPQIGQPPSRRRTYFPTSLRSSFGQALQRDQLLVEHFVWLMRMDYKVG
jgi:hypothetical protein